MSGLLLSILGPAVGFILPMLAGFVTTKLMDGLKSASGWLDRSPILVKRLVVMAFAALLVVGGKLVGVEIDPSTVDGLNVDKTTMQALVAGILSLVLHNSKKIKEAQTVQQFDLPAADRAQPGLTGNVFDTTKQTYREGYDAGA